MSRDIYIKITEEDVTTEQDNHIIIEEGKPIDFFILIIEGNSISKIYIYKGAQHTCALDAVHCQYLGNLLYKMGCVPPIFETL